MMFINDLYTYFIHDLSDSRSANWPMVSVPALVSAIVSYLWIVYVWGPRFMEKREPYSLKLIIAIYNIVQVLACMGLMYGVATSGWTTTYNTYSCQPVDISNKPEALKMAGMVWWCMIVKYVELIETVFFVLRKKQNQVSPLHVYHHVSTLVIVWLMLKYEPGGSLSFTIMLNSFVHVLMYAYYLLTLAGPAVLNKLSRWKKYITMIQMIQLFTILTYNSLTLRSGCKKPRFVTTASVVDVMILLYMFFVFYKNSYAKTKELKRQ